MEFSIHRDLSPNYNTAELVEETYTPSTQEDQKILNWTSNRSGHTVRISLKKKKEDKVHQSHREETLPATTSCCFPSPKCTLSAGILLVALLQCASLKDAQSMTINCQCWESSHGIEFFFLCSSSSSSSNVECLLLLS